MQGGKQTISIGNGCESHGVILHETSHALGLWHEQSRLEKNHLVYLGHLVVTKRIKMIFWYC